LNKINKNWDLFEYKTKIRTYLKKLDENWDQKGILTLIFNIILITKIYYYLKVFLQCFFSKEKK